MELALLPRSVAASVCQAGVLLGPRHAEAARWFALGLSLSQELSGAEVCARIK